MKKICSLALVLCMLLALVAVPTAAETAPEHITFKDTDTTYTDGEGVVYNIIRDKEDFLAIENGKNYIFADNINLDMAVSGANQSAFGASTHSWYEGIMDGNGYAIYGFSGTATNNIGLFYWGSGSSDYKVVNATFKNISFGTEDVPFTYTTVGGGGCGVIAGKVGKGSSVRVINCKAYIETTGNHAHKAAFFGYGLDTGISYYFENCVANGSISANNKSGCFIGKIDKANCSAEFVNCTNNINMVGAKQGTGGFIGFINQTDTVLSFTNCVNNGNISSTISDSGEEGVGGFVGYCKVSNVYFDNCKNTGTITAAVEGKIGALLGGNKAGNAQNVYVKLPVDTTLEEACGDVVACGDTAAVIDVALTANANGTASAGWQKTTADDNGNVKVRLLVAVSDEYLEEIQTMTFTGTFGLTAGGSKTLTMTLGGDKPVKYYSSVVAAGETLVAAEGYVLIPVVVENIPEADWDGTVSMKLTATGSDNVVAYYRYN